MDNNVIATVCYRGYKARSTTTTSKRESDLFQLVLAINQSTLRPQAIIFPGGFFFLNQHIGHLPYPERKRVIESSSIGFTCRASLAMLNTIPPSEPLLVVGIDTAKRPRHGCSSDSGDQLCVAFDKTGVVGIGRKIFPDDYELFDHVSYAKDFTGLGRVVGLPDGRKAVLCACYDMFGIAESPARVTKRTRNIKYIGEGKNFVAEPGEAKHAEVRTGLVQGWADMLKREGVSVGMAAIHQFGRPGLDKYWQRHGVGVASAALGGGLAIGAAHFVEALPAVDKSTLAAVGVPQSHLADGLRRKHYAIRPVESFHITTKHGTALVRSFVA